MKIDNGTVAQNCIAISYVITQIGDASKLHPIDLFYSLKSAVRI